MDYDNLANEYARHRRLHPGVLRDILVSGAVTDRSTVCEVGCGTGNYITAIQSATGCSCLGVDPSDEMLSRAKAQSQSVDWRKGKAEDLPIAKGAMDVVYSVDVIHHVVDRAAAFAQAFEALKPGGRLCTVTDSDEIIRRRLHSHYFPETVPVELQRYPAVSDLRTLMQEAGFVEIAEKFVEHETQLSDIQAYRDKAFSSLHLISDDAWQRGIARMEQDLRSGTMRVVSRYILVWGTKPN